MQRYQPIEDFVGDPTARADADMTAWRRLWQEQRADVESGGKLDRFLARLNREWAVETGLIERLYSLDRGVTRLLIEQGIDAALIPHGASDRGPEAVAALIGDQMEAVEGLFSFVRGERPLSISYVKELHAVLTRHQPTTEALDRFGTLSEVELLRGAWKRQPNNPSRSDGFVHEYAPPELVQDEMDRLITWHLRHESDGVPSEVGAAWLHHRFTCVHPFQDGNGRVARALASLVFIRGGLFPLVVTNARRAAYIGALETADEGDLQPLVRFFSEVQVDRLKQAVQVGGQILAEERRSDAILEAVVESIRAGARTQPEWDGARRMAEACREVACNRFTSVQAQLRDGLRDVLPNLKVYVDGPGIVSPGGDQASGWYRADVIAVAGTLGYFAGVDHFHEWARLKIATEAGQDELVVGFHGDGQSWRGIVSGSAFLVRRAEGDDGLRERLPPEPLCDEPMSIAWTEQEKAVIERFTVWLDGVIARGLSAWRQGVRA